MAPKGSKRASAAPPAAQNEGGKRRKRADDQAEQAASEQPGSGSGSESAGEGTCTCGKCVDDWLSPTLADALQQAATEIQHELGTVLNRLESEGLADNQRLKRKRLRDALGDAGALAALPTKFQKRITINFLKAYDELFGGIKELIGAGDSPAAAVIQMYWIEGVAQRGMASDEPQLPDVQNKYGGCQRMAVGYLLRQALEWIDADEEENQDECANDQDGYMWAAQEMLDVDAAEAKATIEGGSQEDSDGDGSSSGSGFDDDDDDDDYDEESDDEEDDDFDEDDE